MVFSFFSRQGRDIVDMNWATFQTLMTFHEILIRLSSNEWLVYFTCKTGQFFITYIYPKQHVFFHCSKMFPCKCPKKMQFGAKPCHLKTANHRGVDQILNLLIAKGPANTCPQCPSAPPAVRSGRSAAERLARLSCDASRWGSVTSDKWSYGSPYKWRYIWMFPKIVVPPNHPF